MGCGRAAVAAALALCVELSGKMFDDWTRLRALCGVVPWTSGARPKVASSLLIDGPHAWWAQARIGVSGNAKSNFINSVIDKSSTFCGHCCVSPAVSGPQTRHLEPPHGTRIAMSYHDLESSPNGSIGAEEGARLAALAPLVRDGEVVKDAAAAPVSRAAYWIFLAQGVGMLFPWNAFITATGA